MDPLNIRGYEPRPIVNYLIEASTNRTGLSHHQGVGYLTFKV